MEVRIMKRPLKAFSLVELLVVISIIAMLLAILLPSLGRARRQGKRVVCLSNVRQMHIAAITYSQSYDGYFPIAQYSDENTGSRYMLGQRRCEHCRDHELHLDGIARAGIYSGALARLIVAFKHDRTDLSHYINLLALPAFTASAFYQEIEVLVPVPLHWRRNFSRGYNQAHLIARSLQHPTARISLDLARMRNTKMQSSLAFEKRSANIRGAFAVRRGHSFSGKTICLVDDIKTTGATINECARVLKEAGAKKVYAVVIAVAERSS